MVERPSRLLAGAAARRDWVPDADTTIKPLYGHQAAELGSNPKNLGPRHVFVANSRTRRSQRRRSISGPFMSKGGSFPVSV